MIRIHAAVLVALVALTSLHAAHAAPIIYTAALSGAAESPPNASPGTGFAEVDFDLAAHTMRVFTTFSGLLGTTTAAHIHGPTAAPGTGTAGVITTTPFFTGFPIGVTSGAYDHLFDTTLASTYNPAFVTAQGSIAAAEAALSQALAEGRAYFNIHTTVVPGGEIRGFLTALPEPGSVALLAGAFLALVATSRRSGPRS